jgi:NAD(P)-dependent dehydrogenase (short-subunit alcohol dehydrogenase family)
MRLNGKTALISGAAQGLGAAMARRFAEEGAVVFIGDLKAEAGNQTAEEIRSKGGKAFFLTLDVTCEQSWIDALAAVRKEGGRPDILVNNAGINIREPVESMKVEILDSMLAVNVKGPFLGTKHVIPLMRNGGGGLIINISSVSFFFNDTATTEIYTMTKGAVTLLTKAIAVRYAKDNIRCNSIHPSTVDTPLVRELFKDPAKKQERLNEVPLGRLATEADVANAALFLASDEASFLNGVALPVDGGVTAD